MSPTHKWDNVLVFISLTFFASCGFCFEGNSRSSEETAYIMRETGGSTVHTRLRMHKKFKNKIPKSQAVQPK